MPSALKFFLSMLALCSLTTAVTSEQYRKWNTPVKPFRIIGNIYYVGASDLTSFLITSPRGHILLDGGLPQTAPQIERNVAALGFNMKDVKLLLNSHAHFDHAGGLAELKRISGARMIASRQDAPALMDGDKDDFAWPGTVSFPSVHVDRIVADGESLTLGEIAMTAHLTPGSTSVPGYQLIGNSKYPNIVANYEQTFRALRSLPCEVFLGSHGAFFDLTAKHRALERGVKPNPFIDPDGYRSFIDGTEHEFRRRLSEQAAKKQHS
jgi:metallo-beta-lactamase class B